MYECQRAFNDFFANLANRPVAILLKRIVFPWGDAYKRPSDQLDHKIVQTMWSDNELRDRITRFAYIGNEADDPAFIVEDAFIKIMTTKATRDAIRKAIKEGALAKDLPLTSLASKAVEQGVCKQEDADAYVAAEQARDKAIQVDDHLSLHFSKEQR